MMDVEVDLCESSVGAADILSMMFQGVNIYECDFIIASSIQNIDDFV